MSIEDLAAKWAEIIIERTTTKQSIFHKYKSGFILCVRCQFLCVTITALPLNWLYTFIRSRVHPFKVQRHLLSVSAYKTVTFCFSIQFPHIWPLLANFCVQHIWLPMLSIQPFYAFLNSHISTFNDTLENIFPIQETEYKSIFTPNTLIP